MPILLKYCFNICSLFSTCFRLVWFWCLFALFCLYVDKVAHKRIYSYNNIYEFVFFFLAKMFFFGRVDFMPSYYNFLFEIIYCRKALNEFFTYGSLHQKHKSNRPPSKPKKVLFQLHYFWQFKKIDLENFFIADYYFFFRCPESTYISIVLCGLKMLKRKYESKDVMKCDHLQNDLILASKETYTQLSVSAERRKQDDTILTAHDIL